MKDIKLGKGSEQELAALRQNQEKLKALLHVLPVGISILDKDRKPVYTNPALKKILGLSERDLRKRNYRKRRYLNSDGSEMPEAQFPSIRVFDEGRPIDNVEVGIVKEDSSTIWAVISAVPLLLDDWQAVLTVSDITDRKQLRDSLRAQTNRLFERVKELNCLYGIADLVERPNVTLDEILQGTAELIPPAWHQPKKTCAQILYNGQEYMSKDFQMGPTSYSCDIFVYGQLAGKINIHLDCNSNDRTTPLLKEETSLLEAVSERLGRIIERFQAEEKLVHLAITDPLTGLYNRRHFFDLARNEVERSKRYGHSLACIMFDVDYFKNINDSCGHMVGDQVLQEMVRRCRENIRRVDIFARYGGDEFAILLPEADIQKASLLSNRLCEDFKKGEIKVAEQEIRITLSMGVASMAGSNGLHLDTLLIRADQALYVAKQKGRNQVSVWSETN
jgi:diguanylate cyclase (GGDEF)-like protein/PAS domain S-box-containing protein